MKRSRWQLLRILIPLLIFILGCDTGSSSPSNYAVTYDRAYLAILGEASRLLPGSTANFLVQVRNPYDQEDPVVADAEVRVQFFGADRSAGQEVFSGYTDRAGVVEVRFPTPDDLAPGEYQMSIETEFDGVRRVLQQPVYVGRVYNVLVSTDKPVYQPGQVIHLRGLALDALDLHAADAQTMTLTVADPQGNKLLQKELATSAYGVASIDFAARCTRPPAATTRSQRSWAPTSSTRSVEVKPYTLPRFEIAFQPRQDFLPARRDGHAARSRRATSSASRWPAAK
jgi:uncharacterized protein YfaS (alpha-2-macroglobulin family)